MTAIGRIRRGTALGLVLATRPVSRAFAGPGIAYTADRLVGPRTGHR